MCNMKINETNAKKYIQVVFVCCFIVLAVMAFCSPLAGDDYIYAFNDNSTIRPLRLIDIIWNIQTQRESTSARFISHFFVQLFIMVSKPLFNILNAAVNTAALYVLYRFFRSEGMNSKNLYLLLCTVFLIWVFMPVFGEIYVWLDGACNYSWGIALLICFLLPYYNTYIRHAREPGTSGIILFLLCSPVMGAYSENGSAAGIMISFFLMLLIYIRDRKIPWYLFAGFVLACGGYLFLISSPVISRKGDVSVGMIEKLFTKLAQVWTSISSRFGMILPLAGLVALCLFIVFAVYVLKKRRYIKILVGVIALVWLAAFIIFLPESKDNVWKTLCAVISEPSENLITLSVIYGIILIMAIYRRVNTEKLLVCILMPLAGIVSIVVFVFAIYFPARSCCYYTVLTVLSSVILLSELMEMSENKKPFRLFASTMAALFIICFAAGMADSFSIASQHTQKLEKIYAAQAAGEKTIELHPYYYNTKYAEFFGIDNIGNMPCWLNHYMGMYYGFDDLIGID